MSAPGVEKLRNSATVSDVVAVVERDGGVIIEDFLSQETLNGFREDLYPLLNHTSGGEDDFLGMKTRRLGKIFGYSRHMQTVALDPLYQGVARAILCKSVDCWVGDERVSYEPEIQVGVSQAIQIWPGEGAQPLHRDDIVFMWRHPTYGREARVQIMIAITDFTAENGGTLTIPGSHKWDDQRKPNMSEAVPTVMSAGSALIWLGSVYHAGGRNRSSEPRTGLTMAYDASNLRQEENQYLSLPHETVKSFPEELQRLLGWNAGKNFMGYVVIDGKFADPINLLRE